MLILYFAFFLRQQLNTKLTQLLRKIDVAVKKDVMEEVMKIPKLRLEVCILEKHLIVLKVSQKSK